MDVKRIVDRVIGVSESVKIVSIGEAAEGRVLHVIGKTVDGTAAWNAVWAVIENTADAAVEDITRRTTENLIYGRWTDSE